MHRLRYVLIVLMLLLPLTLLAQELPPINPGSVTGDIMVGGTTVLVEPTENLSVRFAIDGFVGNVIVTAYPTAEAIQRFCSGELDIALTDRQFTPEETNACSGSGRSLVPFRIGTKSMTVAVSPLNEFVNNLSTAQLQQIFSGSPNWSDIQADWPTEVIRRYGPGTTSPTVNYFAQIVFGGDTTAMTTALGAQYNDDPNIALDGVAGSEFAIGVFDSAFLDTNRDFVRPLAIDNVEARFDAISNGTYPLARPLLLYSGTAVMREKPQVAEFLKYYLSNMDLELPAVNLYPASVEAQQIAVNSWLSATGQTVTQPTATAPAPAATEEALVIDPLPEATEEAVIEPVDREPQSPFAANVLPLLIAARTDLEEMATEVMGIQRPPGWSGSLEVNDGQLPLLIRLDVELLAAIVYGEAERPEGWFGAVGSSQLAIVRDIRHDLELMADEVYNGSRPTGWVGGDPIYRCNRSTQALVAVLQRAGLYALSVDPAAPNYCQQIEVEVARFAEVNLMEGGRTVFSSSGEAIEVPREAEITGDPTVAFFDRFATQRVGVMPVGTQITPVARSFVTGSNMTIVEGTDFLVFVEYVSTNLTEAQWELLPNIDDMDDLDLYCQAVWCR